MLGSKRNSSEGDAVRYHEVEYDEQVLKNLRKPETRSGPVLRWDRILAHRKKFEPKSKSQDLISYAQTLSPDELQHFYDAGEISESDSADLLAALPIEIFQNGKALDYLQISPEQLGQMDHRMSLDSQRMRKSDELVEQFLRFSLSHPDAKVTDFRRSSGIEDLSKHFQRIHFKSFYRAYFKNTDVRTQIKPAQWRDFFRAYKDAQKTNQDFFDVESERLKAPAKDLDPIVALGSMNRSDLEKKLSVFDLLSTEELRELSPKKLAHLKEGVTHGLASAMRNQIFLILLGVSVVMGGLGEKMVAGYSNEGIRANARGMMNVFKAMLDNSDDGESEFFRKMSPIGEKLIEVGGGENPELARELTKLAQKIVANNTEKIASFYAYLPVRADQRLLQLTQKSNPEQIKHALAYVQDFDLHTEFVRDLDEVVALDEIYNSDKGIGTFKKTQLLEKFEKLRALHLSLTQDGSSVSGSLDALRDLLARALQLFDAGAVQPATDLLLSERETIETQMDELAQDWRSNSSLFDFYTAVTAETDLSSEEDRAQLSLELKKFFQKASQRKSDLKSVDANFLGEQIIFTTLWDDARGEDENPGGTHYQVANGEMLAVAEAAMKREKKNIAEPAPTRPETAGGEDITEGVYKSEILGAGKESVGIVMGVDAKAQVYFDNLEDFRKKFFALLGAISLSVMTFMTRRFRKKFAKPIEQMMPIVEQLGRGSLEVDFSDLPTERKDEIGALARVVKHLAEVNRDVIAAMVDPVALKRVIKYWDRPEELFGLKELDTAVCFTDTRNSTELYQKLGNEHFQQLVGMLNNNTARGFVADGGVRTNKFDGDGLILTLSDEPEKDKSAASKMMRGAVESYRQTYVVNYIAKKLGCHTADTRFGLHYGKIYAGLQQYLDTPDQAHKHQVSSWFHKINKLLWEKEEIHLAKPQGRKLHRIIEGMEGLGISIASRYQPASKGYTHFAISPEWLTEIASDLENIPHIKAIGERRDVAKSANVKNAIAVHDVIIDVSDLEEAIDAIFDDHANGDLIASIRNEIQEDASQFFLNEESAKKEAEYEAERKANLEKIVFRTPDWWHQKRSN